MVVDHGGWFAGSDSAGINACGEMPDESERGFDVRDVDGVRIRKQGQPAACREAFEKRVGEKRDRVEHTVPTLAEFFKAE